MKILLDESLPTKLQRDFGKEHEVWTVKDKGWFGKKNGALLKLMIEDSFEIFITVDRNLPYQQSLEQLPLIIIVLCAVNNRRETLKALVPKIFERIATGRLQNVIQIS